MSAPTVSYTVPNLGLDGGIQRFALDQLKYLRDDFNVTLTDWVPQLAGHRSLDLQQCDLIHHWHIDPCLTSMARPEPFILTCHALEIMRSWRPTARGRRIRRAISRAAAVTVPSTFTADYLCANYDVPSTKVHVIHPGVHAPKAPRLATGAGQKPVIGTLSRLVPRKNVTSVVDALDVLHNQGLNFRYLLAGDGPAREDILTALGRSRFEWTYLGRVDDKGKRLFYESIDCFALPTSASRRDVEGFGIVYLEANAASVPVVASPSGGVTDAVSNGNSGLFVNPLDVDSIAQGISDVLHDLENYRRNAWEWARQFPLEKTAARFSALYRSVLADAGYSKVDAT